jgi:carbon storage regulator CsrA
MLKLWRNVGERIVIADGEIFVTVTANQNNIAARLQIDAPTLFSDSPRTVRVAKGEKYPLTDKITLHVLEVERAGVRFQIDAPREIRIDREEVYNQRQGK